MKLRHNHETVISFRVQKRKETLEGNIGRNMERNNILKSQSENSYRTYKIKKFLAGFSNMSNMIFHKINT